MYSYNSYHKIITIALVVAWAIYQFSGSQGEENLRYPNGQLKVSGGQVNERNQGTWTWYYPNGSIQLQGNFENGYRTGEWKRYDDAGQLTMHCTYVQNRLEGLYTEYDPAGNILRQTEYRADTVVKRLEEAEFHEPFKP